MIAKLHLLRAALCLLTFGCSKPQNPENTDVVATTEVATIGEPQIKEIPSEYRGQWTNHLELCGHEGWDQDSSLYVGQDSAGYYDNSYKVSRVQVTPEGLHLEYEARADADIDPVTFMRLSSNGNVLIIDADQPNQGLRRCPATKTE